MEPSELPKKYLQKKTAIKKRLNDFSKVPPSEYFYELAFCLLTPQSKQKYAEIVIEKLKKRNFIKKPFNPTPILRDPKHYIRFHNVKGQRLLQLRKVFPSIYTELTDRDQTPESLRELLLQNVTGLGWKEASHFLRNIGFRGLAILDRHILKHLHQLKVIPDQPKSISPKRYKEIEQCFLHFSNKVSIPMDELDLLFWSEQTGEIRK